VRIYNCPLDDVGPTALQHTAKQHQDEPSNRSVLEVGDIQYVRHFIGRTE
jgi:hypothetical protein